MVPRLLVCLVHLLWLCHEPTNAAPSGTGDVKDPLQMSINEVNVKDTSTILSHEFIELRSHASTPRTSLNGYMIVGIRGLRQESGLIGASLELYVPLWNDNLKPSR